MNPGGILLIDKPEGISSFAVVRQLRKITGIRKIGHAGTLDPFASGLLIMCLGFATRIAGRLLLDDKTYVVKMKLGITTDTGDLTGEIIDTAEPPVLTEEKLTETVKAILQISEQTPPRYSAVKVGGRRAYQLARNKQDFTLQPRSVEIKNFSFTSREADVLEYLTSVSKGTYIRVLSETIAGLLGTQGVTTYLRRIQAGSFRVEDAIRPELLTEKNWQERLISLEAVFASEKRINLPAADAEDFLEGRTIPVKHAGQSEIAVFQSDIRFLGFGRIGDGVLYPKMVLK